MYICMYVCVYIYISKTRQLFHASYISVSSNPLNLRRLNRITKSAKSINLKTN